MRARGIIINIVFNDLPLSFSKGKRMATIELFREGLYLIIKDIWLKDWDSFFSCDF